MFISLIELLIHFNDTTSKSYVLIYHPDSNELSSLNLDMLVALVFFLSSMSRMKPWPSDRWNNESAKIPGFWLPPTHPSCHIFMYILKYLALLCSIINNVVQQ